MQKMEWVISKFPPEIFKQIALDLEDEDLGALYSTGDRNIISLLYKSVTHTKYNRRMFSNVVESIDVVMGDIDILPPNIKSIETFIVTNDNCIKTIPNTVTSLGISCDELVYLDYIPKTIENLIIYKLKLYDDYVFRDGYKSITISNLALVRPDIRIIFPKSTINVSVAECSNVQTLGNDVYVMETKEYKYSNNHRNLAILTTEILYDAIPLPLTITNLCIVQYITTDSKFMSHLSSLCHLNTLHIGSTSNLIAYYIPTSVVNLTVVIRPVINKMSIKHKYGKMFISGSLDGTVKYIRRTDEIFTVNSGVRTLYYDAGANPQLPNTLTHLTMPAIESNKMDGIDLPNLTYLNTKFTVAPNSVGGMILRNFNDYPQLKHLSVTGYVFLKNLPKSLVYLDCSGVSGSELPPYLQIFIARSVLKYTIDIIRNKLPFCKITAKRIVNDIEQSVINSYVNLGIDYLLIATSIRDDLYADPMKVITYIMKNTDIILVPQPVRMVIIAALKSHAAASQTLTTDD